MATGNLLMGTARGRLGDMVLYRESGRQHYRARVSNPSNPQTEKQMYQRAVVATIMQAYSAGSIIFDHSFQGIKKGRDNMNAFLGRNTRLLRETLADELANTPEDIKSLARFVGPKAVSPVGFCGMIISYGSYAMNSHIQTMSSMYGRYSFAVPTPDQGYYPMSEWNLVMQFVANDYYTFCGYLIDTNLPETFFPGTPYDNQYQGSFWFARYRVKGDKLYSSDDVSSLKLSDVWELDAYSGNINPRTILSKTLSAVTISLSDFVMSRNYSGTIGLIRSRKDRDLRSTSRLYFDDLGAEWGINYRHVIDHWLGFSSEVGNSELILEGGNNVANTSAYPIPTPAGYTYDIYADAQCTTRPTGRVNALYVKIGRAIGYGDDATFRNGNVELQQQAPHDSAPNIQYKIILNTRFESSERPAGYAVGDIITLAAIIGAVDVSTWPTQFAPYYD